MLRSLRVRNLALLDDLTLDFAPGLNVITGETGGGKTLLLRAIALAIGRKAATELVRAGEESLRVEAVFDVSTDVAAALEEIGIPAEASGADSEPPVLVVRRTIGKSGRGQVTLNDHVSTLATLVGFGDRLVQIYGQHEQIGLMDPTQHLAVLDAASGCEEERRRFAEQYQVVASLIARL